MKTPRYLLVVVLASVLACRFAAAGPQPGSSAGKDYLVNTSNLSLWSFGFYTKLRDRDVRVLGMSTTLEETKIMGYVGFHAMPWATLYGSYGVSSRELGFGNDEDESEYGAGIHVNILDHMFSDPYLIEDRIRLDGYIQYHVSDTGIGSAGNDVLQERSAALLLSIVSRPEAKVQYWPHAINLYVGAVYSDLDGGGVDETKSVGLTAGLQFFITEGISVDVGIERFERMGYTAGLHVDL